jgi:predicted anti-sigma-YlaC factor YlaD
MTCKEVNQFLADYLDYTLPWSQRVSFNIHLLICRHCRQYLASYAATVRMTKLLGDPTEPNQQQVPDELVRAILAARRPRTGAQTDGQSP